MFGDMLSADPRDVVHARLIVVWGANPTISNVHFPPLGQRGAPRRARALIVVDPRRTAMAERADRHLAPMPGTDVVLALAMAAHLDRAGLVDRAFLEQHTEGADAFLDAARQWSPEAAESDLRRARGRDHRRRPRSSRASRPAYFRVGWGLERNRNGGSACVAAFALPVLTGQFGVARIGHLREPERGRAAHDGPRDPAERRTPRVRHVNMNRLGAMLCRPRARSADRRALRPGREPGGVEPEPTGGARRARGATTCSPSCTTRCSPTPPASPTSCSRRRPTSRRVTSPLRTAPTCCRRRPR